MCRSPGPGHAVPVQGWGRAARIASALGRRSREREAAVQAVKAALAAVLALLAARWLSGAPGLPGAGHTFLAPYAALLAVTTTVRRSWAGAGRQAAMVVAGVLLAYGAGQLAAGTLPGLPLAVVLGLLLGRWRRFAGDRDQIAVTAVLLLVNGVSGNPAELAGWVVLSLIGSVVGASVNTFVLPPLHLRDAHDAVRTLACEIGDQLRVMAEGVREGWTAGDAARWVAQARALRAAVRRADDAVWFGRESVRWNPRRRSIRLADAPLAAPDAVDRVGRLGERAVQVAVLLGDLTDLAEGAGRPGQEPDPVLADLLERLASAVDTLADRFEAREDLAEAIAGPAAAVRQLRADVRTEPIHVRSTCLVTISDALGDLTRLR